MLSTPYREATIEQVAPGDVVEHDLAPFVVDELRRTVDGWTVLGWPRRRQTHRRAAFDVKPGDVLRVYASGDAAAEVASALLAALRDVADGWSEPTDTPLDADVTGTALLVRAGGHVWRVQLTW